MLPRVQKFGILCGVGAVLSFSVPQRSIAAGSDQATYQPYIEQLKNELNNDPRSKARAQDAPSIEEVQKALLAEHPGEKPGTSYTEELRKQDSSLQPSGPSESFIEQERKKLEPRAEGGAIQAVKEGKSKLELKTPGDITNAFGLRYIVEPLSKSYTLTSGGTGVAFDSIYGQGYAPQLSVFYEVQLFHNEYLGSLGLTGIFGVNAFSGVGTLATAVQDPRTQQPFPTASQTKFQFLTFPSTIAATYRFNLLRFLRPYISVGPTAVGFWEIRSDDKHNSVGLGWALYGSVGVSILLDWMSKSTHWDLYADHKIQHSYLTVDYIRYFPLSGRLKAETSGVFIGFAFEY